MIEEISQIFNLHSNMFLLILNSANAARYASQLFTFQYVSINTKVKFHGCFCFHHLHSNMFLLIRNILTFLWLR